MVNLQIQRYQKDNNELETLNELDEIEFERIVFTRSLNIMWRILLSVWRGTKYNEKSTIISSLFFIVKLLENVIDR